MKWDTPTLHVFQEEKPEDDPLSVDVPADAAERRLAPVISSLTLPVLQLHLFLGARELP